MKNNKSHDYNEFVNSTKLEEFDDRFDAAENLDELREIYNELAQFAFNLNEQTSSIVDDLNDIETEHDEEISELENKIEELEYKLNELKGYNPHGSIFDELQVGKFLEMLQGTYLEREKALDAIKHL